MNVLDEFKNYKRKFIQIQEYKTTYDNFILGLENESNSNQ